MFWAVPCDNAEDFTSFSVGFILKGFQFFCCHNGTIPMGLVASKIDKQLIDLIRINGGFVIRKIDGDGTLQSGASLRKEKFDRLIELGLLEEAGDALFGVPSQTWKLKEKAKCSERPNPAT